MTKTDRHILLQDQASAAGTGSGVAGFAKGLMQKGLSIKENMKERASALTPPNLSGLGSNLGSIFQNSISAENFPNKFSSSNFGQISTQKTQMPKNSLGSWRLKIRGN
jgi:hypothetical protein